MEAHTIASYDSFNVTELLDQPYPDSVPITYGLYSKILDSLDEKAMNVQKSMPKILYNLDKTIELPQKISNITRKVRKFIANMRLFEPVGITIDSIDNLYKTYKAKYFRQ